MTMVRPAALPALFVLALGTLIVCSTMVPASGQTLAIGRSSAAYPTLAGVRADYGRLPLSFEPNRGQVADRQVRYLARSAGYTLFLTDRSIIIAEGSARRSVVTLQFQHTGALPQFQAASSLPGRVNYLLGDDPGRWHTNLPTYARVSEHQLYPGVSAVFYGHAGQLEYD
ncbi:MAG: hypothetical protein M3Z66_22340 [Chloroflexota bacterium]|nr:hypothetical protein [Chloroflexota bacterium]